MSEVRRAGSPLSTQDKIDIRRDIGLPLPTSGDAGSGQVVTGGDTRLTDARTPSGTAIAAATAKTTPVDGDSLPISDSAASGGLKRLTWANLKATLKTYFDTLYRSAASAIGLTTDVTGVLPVANGGTGTATPGLVAGTNVTVTGTWPNQTIAASGGGGGGATNIGSTASPTGIDLTSSTGTGTTLPLADGTNSGLQSPAQFTKLAGIGAGANVTSVAGKTGVVTLAAADIGDSTPAGRALLTAADAPAQRTALGLGTAATTAATAYATAAQGAKADSAVQPTIADAKGDLIVATGADTLARLAVGTNGHVLTADSSEASGMKWAAAAGGGAAYEVATFADLPDPTTVTAGRVYTVLGAICPGGALGTQWASDGTLWRPAGRQVIWQSSTAIDGVSGGTTAWQPLAQALLPAGLLRGCRRIIPSSRWNFSGTDPATRTCRWHLGSAGTSSDQFFVPYAASSTVAANSRVATVGAAVSVVNATTLRALANLTSSETVGAVGSVIADTTVSSLVGALYLTAAVQQGAAPTTTATLAEYCVEVL